MILQCVRWYIAYSLGYRDQEELMQERGYKVDHSTIQRWVVHYAPLIEKVCHKNKKRTGLRWRLDETYIKIKGAWKCLYRAVDKQGKTIDFLLTAKRDTRLHADFLTMRLDRAESPVELTSTKAAPIQPESILTDGMFALDCEQKGTVGSVSVGTSITREAMK